MPEPNDEAQKLEVSGSQSVDAHEDDLILRALGTRDPQADQVLSQVEREYREVAGLLAHQIAPAQPAAHLKARLFGALGLASAASAAAGREAKAPEQAPVVPLRAAGARRLLPLAMAAAALLALGMASWAGYLAAELRQEQQVVADLRAQLLGEAVLTAEQPLPRASLRSGFEMVAAPGTKVCDLDSRDPNQPNAVASVLLQPAEGRWVLDARNLKRCPLGRVYQVWFLTEAGPVRGGAFQIRDLGPIVLGSDDLPPGTQAVMVTLEDATEIGSEPAGTMVLFGDESRELL